MPLWLESAWHFVFGWPSLLVLVGAAATAIAILEPKQLDAITDLRKWAIVVAFVAFTCTGLLAHGYSNGLAEKQRQWDNALVQEGTAGEKARSDAVDSVGPVPSDRSVFSDDKWNRDAGTQPIKHASPVRWLASHHLFGKKRYPSDD